MIPALDALALLERSMEKKADMKLVLDKVSRSEYSAAVQKLRAVDEEILNRSVNREEYRLQLNEIREVMSEDQRERVANIARMEIEEERCARSRIEHRHRITPMVAADAPDRVIMHRSKPGDI